MFEKYSHSVVNTILKCCKTWHFHVQWWKICSFEMPWVEYSKTGKGIIYFHEKVILSRFESDIVALNDFSWRLERLYSNRKRGLDNKQKYS